MQHTPAPSPGEGKTQENFPFPFLPLRTNLFCMESESGLDLDSERWREAIDASPYSPNEWREAAKALTKALATRKQRAAPKDVMEYLSCCAGSASGVALLPLPELALDFLKTHGMEKARPLAEAQQ